MDDRVDTMSDEALAVLLRFLQTLYDGWASSNQPLIVNNVERTLRTQKFWDKNIEVLKKTGAYKDPRRPLKKKH